MKLIKPVSPAGVGKRTDHPIKTSKHDSNSMDANINNFLDYNKKKKTIWMIFNHDVALFSLIISIISVLPFIHA